ncbi:MAG: VCBS repeat-containing protein [Acidobacteriota bacterium]
MQSKVYVCLARAGRWIGKGRTGRVALLSLLLTAVTATGMWAGFRDSLAQSGGDPDYSGVDDFTYGAKHLLRNDDLVMTFSYVSANGDSRDVMFTAGTNDSNPTVINFDQQIIPNGVANCTNSNKCYFDYARYNQATPATGRFFNTDRDWIVQYPFQFDRNQAPFLVAMSGEPFDATITTGAKLTWQFATEVDFVIGGNSFPTAVADFNGDGYDDLLMGWYDGSKFPSNTTLRIAYATKPDDPSQGFTFGPTFSVPNQFGIRDMTVGDFDGDGQPEIAALYIAQDRKLYAQTMRVNKDTLEISKTDGDDVAINQMADTNYHPISMTAGQFTALGHQQLMVASQSTPGANVQINVIDFAEKSITPKIASTFTTTDGNPNGDSSTIVKLKAARFNWQSAYDQVAFMTSNLQGSYVFILTVDPVTMLASKNAEYALTAGDGQGGGAYFGREIAVGNFDHMKPSEADPTKEDRNPNLQVAMIGIRQVNSYKTMGLVTLSVSEDFKSFTQENYTILNEVFTGGNQLVEISIASLDLRGRSFRLGAGYKVTVDQTMPTVVLAVPPMHTDYVSPGIGQPPTVLNLSTVPDAFTSVYEESGSTSTTFTDTETTSSSFSGEESLNQKVALGSFDVVTGALTNGVSIEDTFTAKQDLENSNDTINGSFNSSDFDVSQNTGLSDVIWYRDSSYYLYVYPVIGRKVCPAGKADKNGNCADSDKVPLRLMYSAPKAATIQRLATDTVEWYQPPWEFGNLLSYPAGLDQLKLYIPDINLLTKDTGSFATDDASATIKTTWSNGRTTGTNIDQKKLFTEDNDLSVEGVYSVKFFGQGGSGSTKLDLNFGGSNGTNSLTESSTQFNSARGMTITKTASFATPNAYKYFFSPFIFGKIQPVGYTDPVPAQADDLLVGYGTLRSAFTVDPIGSAGTGAGGWWSQSPYKQFPDVAVNHPNRWSYGAQPKPSNGIIPANCIGIDNVSMDCVTPNLSTPENPWLDAFHDMRGFFITDATNPPNSNPFAAGGGGAQLEMAKAGDKLTLSTRVYNYSFKAMPAGAKVKVRFYGMEWDTTNNFPADAKLQFNNDGSITIVDPGGKSFLIGEVPLAPISPFNNGPQAPLNWALASTNFDTTPYENKALVFWVAVWMEDANGILLQEVASHGLTGLPASTATPFFKDLVALEQMVDNPLVQSDTDPAKVSFSNNIGFYKSAFHILPKTSATSSAARAAADSVGVESVRVDSVSVKPGKSTAATVMLRGGKQELNSLTVYFYDGDPAAGGQLIDAERVARLRAGGRQAVNILFRPKACGSHQLFVRVTKSGDVIASAQATQSVQLDCAPPVCTTQLCMRSAQYYSLNLGRLPKGVVTVAGRGAQSQVSTSETPIMRILLQGGNGAQQKFNQQFVATQLNLISQPGANPSALNSNLVCYGINFQPVQLKSKATLNPGMTLGQLFEQARIAASTNNLIDMRQISAVLQLLNGNDPSGRCRR